MRKKISKIKETIILLDFSNQVFRAHHGTIKKMSANSEGIHTGSIIGLVKIIYQAIKSSKLNSSPMTKLVVCEDRKPIRKRELYRSNQIVFKDYCPDRTWDGVDNLEKIKYKGNRVREDLGYDPIEICTQFLDCIPHTKVWCENEEADDVIASYIESHKDSKIILYSSDKDMWQLLDKYPNLKIFLDGNEAEPTNERMETAFSTTNKNKILLHKIIRGDSGDNVKGVRNFPFKKTLDAFTLCDGSFESYFSNLVRMFGEQHRAVKLIMENFDLIKLNIKLVKLRTNLKYEEKIFRTKDLNKWKYWCNIYETPSILNMRLANVL